MRFRKDKTMRHSEMVSRGSEIGVNDPRTPRTRKWLITVKYNDGEEEKVLADGRCFTFIESGFLVAFRREWQFYDVGLNKVSTVPKSVLGECLGVANDFYQFSDESEDFPVDSRGKRIEWTRPWVEIQPDVAFEYGMSRLREDNLRVSKARS